MRTSVPPSGSARIANVWRSGYRPREPLARRAEADAEARPATCRRRRRRRCRARSARAGRRRVRSGSSAGRAAAIAGDRGRGAARSRPAAAAGRSAPAPARCRARRRPSTTADRRSASPRRPGRRSVSAISVASVVSASRSRASDARSRSPSLRQHPAGRRRIVLDQHRDVLQAVEQEVRLQPHPQRVELGLAQARLELRLLEHQPRRAALVLARVDQRAQRRAAARPPSSRAARGRADRAPASSPASADATRGRWRPRPARSSAAVISHAP